jgi:uncharacterized protein
MIAVSDLVAGDYLPGNFFSPDAYVQGDFESGLIENRQGARLVALPEVLIQAIYTSLEAETGDASGIVLYNCGRWWGKNFYRRFVEEVSAYYSRPVAEMEMSEFLQCLKQCWKTHGWGTLEFNIDHYHQGFLVIKVWNSTFAAMAPKGSNKPMCFVEAGLLSSFFSQLTGRDLQCIQTECEAMGAEANLFVIALKERVDSVATLVEEGHSHQIILERLVQTQMANRN